MSDLRRIDFKTALQGIRLKAERDQKRADRAEDLLDRIFKAEDTDQIMEAIDYAERQLRMELRA